jgi:3-phenylpropionate/trans-cinnamate dioxygenase ferredoxin reductase subunit
VAIVGASLAGLRAAEGLRDEGFAGRIVLIGEELHLPYDRPPLSKQVLAGTWPPEKAVLADRVKLDSLRIEQHLGRRAVALDTEAREVRLDDGEAIGADAIVLATGAVPRRLPGTEHAAGIHVLRTLDDSVALRDELVRLGAGTSVLVVGAGFIGSEVAATCHGLGCAVTVVEMLDTPLEPVLGPAIGEACANLHRRNGVSLRTGVGVRAVHSADAGADGTGGRVELSDGTTVSADVVVVGIGVSPAVGWLEGSGVTLGDGVHCDAALFAADGVVAAGDLARWSWRHHGEEEEVRIEHWQVAAEQGAAAARSLVAGRRAAPEFNPVPYFWSDQYGLRIQVLGRPGPDDEVAVVHGSLEEERFVALYGRSGRLSAALAISRPRQLMAFRPLLEAGATFDEARTLVG